jgi:hypothetical protein
MKIHCLSLSIASSTVWSFAMSFAKFYALFVGTAAFAADNAVFQDLLEKGVAMSDGSTVKLPEPFLADGLDADAQQAVLQKLCRDAHSQWDDVMRKSGSAPIVMKVRTVRAGEEGTPSIRAVDLWFVVYGDWDVMTSESFLKSLAKHDDEGKNSLVTRSGVVSDEELAKRPNIEIPKRSDSKTDVETRFVYTTFRLFDRVEISATREAAITRCPDSVLAAAKIDARFNDDAEYPNQWRPLERDALAEIQLGAAHPFNQAGGYAKITRLKQPADAIVIECHLVFEEPYAWFDGVNLVKQKTPPMVQEQARTFRRKLANASQK